MTATVNQLDKALTTTHEKKAPVDTASEESAMKAASRTRLSDAKSAASLAVVAAKMPKGPAPPGMMALDWVKSADSNLLSTLEVLLKPLDGSMTPFILAADEVVSNVCESDRGLWQCIGTASCSGRPSKQQPRTEVGPSRP